VHVAVNEAKPVFHDILPGVAVSPLSPRTGWRDYIVPGGRVKLSNPPSPAG
jgi:hypothetical protein